MIDRTPMFIPSHHPGSNGATRNINQRLADDQANRTTVKGIHRSAFTFARLPFTITEYCRRTDRFLEKPVTMAK